jgi:hypothetical protein
MMPVKDVWPAQVLAFSPTRGARLRKSARYSNTIDVWMKNPFLNKGKASGIQIGALSHQIKVPIGMEQQAIS